MEQTSLFVSKNRTGRSNWPGLRPDLIAASATELASPSVQACLKVADEGDIAHHEFRAGPGAVFHFEMPVIRIILDAPVIASPFDAPAAGQKLIAATLEPEIGKTRPARQHGLDVLHGDGLAFLGKSEILEQAGSGFVPFSIQFGNLANVLGERHDGTYRVR